jgi:glycosyltransferase involved in cell wall biosynthesis
MNYSLVIPCYNEEKNLPILINKYKKFLINPRNELVLVNNGSVDDTEKFFKKLTKIKNIKICRVKKNIGFGYGLKKGLLASSGKILIYSHADLEVNPNDIIKSIKLFEKNRYNKKIFIKGNRIKLIKNNWTYIDIFFSYGYTVLNLILFRKNIYDIHGMPVVFSKKLLKNLNYFPNEFSIDLALYVHALKNHYKVIRFPVNFNKNKRKYGEGSSDNIIKCIKNSFVQFYHAWIILVKLK